MQLEQQKVTGLNGSGGHMSEAEYDRQRAKIAPTKAQAGIRWEQELARLFYRSGWTQDQLAKKEGMHRGHISKLLKFGQFLLFLENAHSNAPIGNLSQKRFGEAWKRTARANVSHLHDRDRFREVAKIIEVEAPNWRKPGVVRGSRKHPPISHEAMKGVVKKLGNGKWQTPEHIAEVGGFTVNEVPGALKMMLGYGAHGAKAEKRKVGKDFHYRIFKQERTVSLDELTEKLAPLVKELVSEGKKNMATMSPGTVAMLAAKIKRLLDEWAE